MICMILNIDLDSDAVNQFFDEGKNGLLPYTCFDDYTQLSALAQKARELKVIFSDAAPDVLPDYYGPWSEGPQTYTS